MLNANRYNFLFFLPKREKVESLEKGAIAYGGATKVKDTIYSNCGEGNFIEVNPTSNELSIFVPSTINVSEKVDSTQYVEKILTLMHSRFDNVEVIADCKGSWYSNDLKKVIVEDIVIIKAYVQEVLDNDIMFMTELAKVLKKDMSQEGVTVTINESLAII